MTRVQFGVAGEAYNTLDVTDVLVSPSGFCERTMNPVTVSAQSITGVSMDDGANTLRTSYRRW